MRKRFETAVTLIGFAVGIAMGVMALGLILLRIAPAFKVVKI